MAYVAAAVAVAVAVSYISYRMEPKVPPGMDTQITSSSYGDPYPIIYGTVRIGTKLIAGSNSKGIQSDKKGKGTANGTQLGKTGKQKSGSGYLITADLAYGICEGPIDDLLIIWANGIVIYDKTGVYVNSGGEYVNMGNFHFTFYHGTEDQLPDPTIEYLTTATVGQNSTPAYRGISYIVFNDMDLTSWGGSVPTLNVQVTRNGAPTYPTRVYTPIADSTVVFGTNGTYDWSTQLYYSFHSTGINVYDLVAGKQLYAYTPADMGIADVQIQGTTTIIPGCSLLVIDQNNNSSCFNIDLNSMKLINSFQLPNIYVGTLFGFPISLAGYVPMALIFQVGSGSGQNINLLDVTVGEVVWSLGSVETDAKVVENDANGFRSFCFCPGELDAGTTTVYCLPNNDLDGQINIYALTVTKISSIKPPSSVTFTVLDTISLSDIGLTTGGVSLVEYDMTDGGLIMNIGNVLCKWVQGMGISWYIAGFTPDETAQMGGTGRSLITDSYFGFHQTSFPSNTFYMLDTRSGTIYWSTDASNYKNAGFTLGNIIGFNGYYNSLHTIYNGELVECYLNRGSTAPEQLGYIVEDICARCGLSPTQYDASALTTPVTGYVLNKIVDGRSAIDQLAALYQFYGVEIDGVITYNYLSQTPTLTITQDELGEAKSSDKKGGDDNFWNHVKKQQYDLPQEVHVKYFDSGLALNGSDQYSRRVGGPLPTMRTLNKLSVQAPVVMGATEAKQRAENILYTTWVSRDTYSSSLGWKYIGIDPGDVMTVVMNDGTTYACRATQTNMGADFTIDGSWEAYDDQTYLSTAISDAGNGFTSPSMAPSNTYSVVAAFDLPYLTDMDQMGDTTSLVYYGVGLYTTGNFKAAIVMKSESAVSAFTQVEFASNTINWGTVPNALPPTISPFIIDNTTNLNVFPYRGSSGTLATVTMTELLSGANMMVVGDEIIAFLTAAMNSDGSYTLTGLLRGCRGTEWAVNSHRVGEQYVFLDRTKINTDGYASNDLGVLETYKAIAVGSSMNTSGGTTISLTGASLKPYAPCQVQRASDGNGGVTLSWTRRTRYAGGLVDNTGTVPLNENAELYSVYVLSAPYVSSASNLAVPTNYVRAFTGVIAPTVDYTSAMLAADGLSAASTLNVVVFQISASVGAGFPGDAVLPAPPTNSVMIS